MSAKGAPRGSALKVGQECDFRIVKLDEFDKKIGLSRRSCEPSHREASARNGQPGGPPAGDSEHEEVASAAVEPA
jgi:predicted RNA-binding protein with RPS1 domain